MAELESIGIPGPAALAETLANSTDPIEDIRKFQDSAGIQLPSLNAAIPMLDLLDVPRLSFCSTVLDDIQKQLLVRVAELGSSLDAASASARKENVKKLLELLEKSFGLVKLASVRPIVLAVLKALPELPETYLKQVRENAALYAEVDVQVKQQIWAKNEALFVEELKPLFDQYIQDKEARLLEIDANGNFIGASTSAGSGNLANSVPSFFAESTKSRRQHPAIVKLLLLIRKPDSTHNLFLYDKLLQQIRLAFLSSRNAHFCSLRAELLMALHDVDSESKIIKLDPCHKFAWCLDACIRERQLDPKHAKELQGVLDGIKKNQQVILADLAMIAADPHATYFLQLLLFKTLSQSCAQDTLPRNNAGLTLIFRLLKLGLNAWKMFKDRQYKEEPLDPVVYTRFIPNILRLFCDDQMRAIGERLPDDSLSDESHACLGEAKLTELLEKIAKAIKSDALCALIAMQYLVDGVMRKDKVAVRRFLPQIAHAVADLSFSSPFLHTWVHYMSLAFAELIIVDEDFAATVFYTFLLKSDKESAKLFALKLIHVCGFMKHNAARAQPFLEALKPNETIGPVNNLESPSSEQYVKFFNHLAQR